MISILLWSKQLIHDVSYEGEKGNYGREQSFTEKQGKEGISDYLKLPLQEKKRS